MTDSNNEVGAAGFPLAESGRLSEFRFSEPFSSPVASPTNLFSATLAAVYIMADDIKDRIWINAAVRWYTNFTALGTADVTFTLLRDGVPIFSITQSAFNPLAAAATVSNISMLQYIDDPLAGAAMPVLTPIVYTLNASTTSTVSFTAGPATLSAAEIEPNSII